MGNRTSDRGATAVSPDLEGYTSSHAETLQRLWLSRGWKRWREAPELLETFRPAAPPPAPPAQLQGALRYLIERNGPRVRERIRQGDRDEETLCDMLGDWEAATADDERFPILFLGLVLTTRCSFNPRCIYCNQRQVHRSMSVRQARRLIEEAATPSPPYVYLTGGEPFLFGKRLIGPRGIISYAARLGCAVNVNTNAASIGPEQALWLVRSGTARLHISIDSEDSAVQGALFQDARRVTRVVRGIANVQLAKRLLRVEHPVIHINCVLTRLNLLGFPSMLRWLLSMRRRPQPPDYAHDQDFAFHLIPVGGQDNAALRPTAEEWARFYTETWQEAEDVWRAHLEECGVPPGKWCGLADHVPFANPWLRAEQHMTFEEYCQRAARGEYWQGALSRGCYVCPSQAYVLPDGAQHWCGAHAIRWPEPLGNAVTGSLRRNIRANLARQRELPGPSCGSCAGATCVINQRMEQGLREQVRAWLREAA